MKGVRVAAAAAAANSWDLESTTATQHFRPRIDQAWSKRAGRTQERATVANSPVQQQRFGGHLPLTPSREVSARSRLESLCMMDLDMGRRSSASQSPCREPTMASLTLNAIVWILSVPIKTSSNILVRQRCCLPWPNTSPCHPDTAWQRASLRHDFEQPNGQTSSEGVWEAAVQ